MQFKNHLTVIIVIDIFSILFSLYFGFYLHQQFISDISYRYMEFLFLLLCGISIIPQTIRTVIVLKQEKNNKVKLLLISTSLLLGLSLCFGNLIGSTSTFFIYPAIVLYIRSLLLTGIVIFNLCRSKKSLI